MVLCPRLSSRKSRDAIVMAVESEPDLIGFPSKSILPAAYCSGANEVPMRWVRESLNFHDRRTENDTRLWHLSYPHVLQESY